MDVIYAVKFVHLVAAGALFGGWLAIAAFMVFAHRSGNTSVVALTAQFVVWLEFGIVAAMVLMPLSGFPLGVAIGVAPDEFWLLVSVAIYCGLLVLWIGAVVVERRIRNLTREAAVKGAPLPDTYRKLFRVWLALALPILAAMLSLFLLMIWQPRVD